MGLAKKMGDAHEEHIAALFEGHTNRGSGNQWANPIDGRQSRMHRAFAFAWDCKSTLAKSITISQAMWDKAREQAGGERPMIPLRFYADEKLRVTRDLVVMDANDVAEVLQAAEADPTWKFELNRIGETRDFAVRLNGKDLSTEALGLNIEWQADAGVSVTINGWPPFYDTEVWVDGVLRASVLGLWSRA